MFKEASRPNQKYLKIVSPNGFVRSLRLTVAAFALPVITTVVIPWALVLGFDMKIAILQNPLLYIVAVATVLIGSCIMLAFASNDVRHMFNVLSTFYDQVGDILIEGDPLYDFKDYMGTVNEVEEYMFASLWVLWAVAAGMLVSTAVFRKKWLMIASSLLLVLTGTFFLTMAVITVVMSRALKTGDVCPFFKDFTTEDLSPEDQDKLEDELAKIVDVFNIDFVETAYVTVGIAAILVVGAVGGSIVAGRVAGPYFK